MRNNIKYKYLSHYLTNEIPIYGNNKVSLNIKQVKAISKGDSANTFCFSMENHWGTHIDTPSHFFDSASSIHDYLPEYWFFNNPQILNITVSENELITVNHLKDSINEETDLLLIKTGFQVWRGKRKYSINNPGIDSEVGLWLRKKYKSIKAIGFDFISISAYQNREEGKKSHKAFLDPNGIGNPILIIEDMNLESDLSTLKQVLVFPFLIKGIDSAPCTIIGILK